MSTRPNSSLPIDRTLASHVQLFCVQSGSLSTGPLSRGLSCGPLLRARRERPSCRSAAEKQYERAAPEKRCQLISLRPRVQPQELRGGHPALSGADALCPMGRSCRK